MIENSCECKGTFCPCSSMGQNKIYKFEIVKIYILIIKNIFLKVNCTIIQRNVLEFHHSILIKIGKVLVTVNLWKGKQDLNLLRQFSNKIKSIKVFMTT